MKTEKSLDRRFAASSFTAFEHEGDRELNRGNETKAGNLGRRNNDRTPTRIRWAWTLPDRIAKEKKASASITYPHLTPERRSH